MNKTLPYTGAAKRGILIVALDRRRRLQNYSPRVQAPGSKPSTYCNRRSPAR